MIHVDGHRNTITSRKTKKPISEITGVFSIIILLSLAIFSTSEGKMIALAKPTLIGPLPQPNANNIYHVTGSKVLEEANVGDTDVFGPKNEGKGGLFPFPETFKCTNDPIKCGVPLKDSKFIGTFEQGNKNHMTAYQFTYTSPITYGPQQIKGHTYKVQLIGTEWNSKFSAQPTRVPEFAKNVNQVGFNQLQHGKYFVDRASGVPPLSDTAFLYGHAKVTDITNGNNKVVVPDAFTHVMVAHVMDDNAYFRTLRDVAKTPTLVLADVANFCDHCKLPNGKMYKTPSEAQALFPPPGDPTLKHPPSINYKQIKRFGGSVSVPDEQSTRWPVDNSKGAPNNPFYFLFFVATDVSINYSTMPTSAGK